MSWEGVGDVRYRRKGGHDAGSLQWAAEESFDPVEFLARPIKRIYEVDPLVCPSCDGEMKVVAFISEHAVVDKILRHLRRRDELERERGPPGHTGLAAVP